MLPFWGYIAVLALIVLILASRKKESFAETSYFHAPATGPQGDYVMPPPADLGLVARAAGEAASQSACGAIARVVDDRYTVRKIRRDTCSAAIAAAQRATSKIAKRAGYRHKDGETAEYTVVRDSNGYRMPGYKMPGGRTYTFTYLLMVSGGKYKYKMPGGRWMLLRRGREYEYVLAGTGRRYMVLMPGGRYKYKMPGGSWKRVKPGSGGRYKYKLVKAGGGRYVMRPYAGKNRKSKHGSRLGRGIVAAPGTIKCSAAARAVRDTRTGNVYCVSKKHKLAKKKKANLLGRGIVAAPGTIKCSAATRAVRDTRTGNVYCVSKKHKLAKKKKYKSKANLLGRHIEAAPGTKKCSASSRAVRDTRTGNVYCASKKLYLTNKGKSAEKLSKKCPKGQKAVRNPKTRAVYCVAIGKKPSASKAKAPKPVSVRATPPGMWCPKDPTKPCKLKKKKKPASKKKKPASKAKKNAAVTKGGYPGN